MPRKRSDQTIQTLVSAAILALGPLAVQAGFPVASVEFQSWESCDVGLPAVGEPTFKADITATPATCDKTTVNRDWNIDNYSFKVYMDTEDTWMCEGVTVWNNDACSGEPAYFLPFTGAPVTQGQCLPEFLEPGFVSVQLSCPGFPGGV